MSSCIFLASDYPLAPVSPSKEYPLVIDLDRNTVFDGNADDNFYLLPFCSTKLYTSKPYGVSLQWNYTTGRARKLIHYIKNVLTHTDSVELWHVWLTDGWEYDDRPVLYKASLSAADITEKEIQELDSAELWNNKDKERPSFYCMTIHR